MQLSVVIITYNEQRNIARCLDSVLPVADEIIVVDSFSTDDTEKICSQYNVKFLQHPFKGHIEQKNYALAQAQFDYVLSLDADEALSETLLQEIKNIKTHCEKDAYSFNRLTNFCGQWIKHCGWYPD
ncbi:MAG: glycosyl transferase, partial [Flavobacteriales bacterium CG18_big_fil_WC_8_21_14_2_50_32_9]